MKEKALIMDENQINRSIARLSHEIIEKNNGAEKVCLLGIKRRGIPIAKQIAENIKKFEGIDVPVGQLDISLYRDDLTEIAKEAITSNTSIPVELEGYTIVLVDDVIYTGRTCRAAIEAVFDKGRPKNIQLAVLVDRGHRELPFRPDFVGKNIPTSRSEVVSVKLPEYDNGEYGVVLGDL
ncbi:MAG: bifunctional pyr operon transcriptional regulator/uracil phosphoribosyltransferase PyrR [Lachnospiraceae bacterium]|nr:bifunctional pyr operon transcriptional regulator/uracil phosphoribosyltransferase PyrR [Lachnospiraceae bacterium]